MVKHGNRSVSSKCGSADVLEALGVPVSVPPEVSRRALEAVGLCFLFAPDYHAGLRHAMAVRRTLGVRTILNLLGPLANPASPRWQVMGVYDERYCVAMAETLGRLGCESALVVHGSGTDEIALHGPTAAAFLHEGRVRTMTLRPEDAGLDPHPLERLKGGEVDENADILRELLQGAGPEAHRAAVAINAGALLMVSGRVSSLRDGTAAALDVLATDRAWQRLEGWKAVLHGPR
jgi:anthranilate phosphoribosyltransferase